MGNISLFDILGKVIPGGLIYFTINHCLIAEKVELSQIILLIIVYILGYLIETVASIFERPIIFKLFGGNPAIRLLNGKSFLDIQIGRLEELNDHVYEKFQKYKDNKIKQFLIFHSIVSKKGYKRVNNFLEQYVFSRNILISYFISGIIYISCHTSWQIITIYIIFLLFFFVRCKQRNYYFAKEVINSYLYLMKIEKTEDNK